MSNYWMFRSNPDFYFIADYWLKDYIRNHPSEPDWWGVPNTLKDAFNSGDVAYVWKADSEPRRGRSSQYDQWKSQMGWKHHGAGVYAVGLVQGEAKYDEITANGIRRFQKYYANWALATGWQWRVYFKYPDPSWIRVDRPLLEKEIEGDPILSRVKNLRGGVNHLTDPEGRKLWQQFFGGDSPPPI